MQNSRWQLQDRIWIPKYLYKNQGCNYKIEGLRLTLTLLNLKNSNRLDKIEKKVILCMTFDSGEQL